MTAVPPLRLPFECIDPRGTTPVSPDFSSTVSPSTVNHASPDTTRSSWSNPASCVPISPLGSKWSTYACDSPDPVPKGRPPQAGCFCARGRRPKRWVTTLLFDVGDQRRPWQDPTNPSEPAPRRDHETPGDVSRRSFAARSGHAPSLRPDRFRAHRPVDNDAVARRLRLIALMGSGVFVVYGLVLPAWPVAVTNIVTTSVHVYHLHRLYRLRRGSEAGSPRLSKAPSIRRRVGGKRRASA